MIEEKRISKRSLGETSAKSTWGARITNVGSSKVGAGMGVIAQCLWIIWRQG